VWGWISDFAHWLYNQIVGIIGTVIDKISTAAQWLVTAIKEKIIDVYEATKAFFKWLYDRTLEIVNAARDHLAQVTNYGFTGLTELVSDIGSKAGDALDELSKKILSALDTAKEWLGDKVHGVITWTKDTFVDPLIDWLKDVGRLIGDAFRGFAEWLFSGLKSLAELVVSFVVGAIDWFKDTIGGILTDIVNRVREALIPGSPPEELNEAFTGLAIDWQKRVLGELEKAAKSPVEVGDVLKVATGIAGISLGVTGVALALGAAGSIKIMGTQIELNPLIRTLLGYLGVEHTIAPIVTLPYRIGVLTPLEHYFNSVYQTKIPGPSDLVRFAVREAWRPELQEGTPEFFIDNMLKMGYKEMWSRYFWAAHWIIPTYEQARRAFWRGIISADEFAELRRYADLAPAYNHIWEGLQYNMPGVRASRWMYEWGTITKEELMYLIKASGIHPEWIEKVADAYILNQLRDEVNRVRTRLISLYVSGYMSIEDLKKEVADLGFREEVVEMTAREAELRKEEEIKDEYVKIYRTAFRKGKITKEEFIGKLQELELQDWRISALVEYEEARAKLAMKTTLMETI